MTLSRPEAACERVLQTLKISKLTFSLNETPFSVYITIRKKFSQTVHDENPNLTPYLIDSASSNTCGDFEMLAEENSILKTKLEEIEKEKGVLKDENKSLSKSNDHLQKSLEKNKEEN